MKHESPLRSLDYTDGWHPTVNPSSRMVIHHFRFVELLQTPSGILNEFPRRRGGCTFRFPRFRGDQFWIQNLPTPLEYVPWWLPASKESASTYLFFCYEQALARSTVLLKHEVKTLELLLRDLQDLVTTSNDLTLGEVLNHINEQQYRQIIPEMPSLSLRSFTKHPARYLFAKVTREMLEGPILGSLLSAWAIINQVKGFPWLAVGHSDERTLYRITWSQREQTLASVVFDPFTGKSRTAHRRVDASWLAEQIEAGKMILGSRLASLLEMLLRSTGMLVRHFGNNYGRIAEAISLLQQANMSPPFPAQDILLCEDDQDSWHVGRIDGKEISYPLHLLDMMSVTPAGQGILPTYTQQSLAQGAPIALIAERSLDETILNRRA